jgi:hypothetical protein
MGTRKQSTNLDYFIPQLQNDFQFSDIFLHFAYRALHVFITSCHCVN